MNSQQDLIPEQDVARVQENRHWIVSAAIADIEKNPPLLPNDARVQHLAAQAQASEIADYLECVGDRLKRIESPSHGSVEALADKARQLEAFHLSRLDALTSI